MESFSEILSDLIVEKGLSLRKLATESGVSAVQYGKYLKGSIPNLSVAVKIANYFQCSIDYLFGLTETSYFNSKKEMDLSKFVKRYEKVLADNNISHYKFAQANNLSESCLRHWRYGEIPKIESLILISKTFDVSIEYLIGRTNTQ